MKASTRGATLVETLIAAFLLALIAIPLFSLLVDGTRLFARGDAASGVHNQLRSAADRMVRELRMAGYDPSATGCAAAFEVAGANTVRFLADADVDGTTDRIEYAYNAANRTLTRQVWRWVGPACANWGPGSGAAVVALDVDSVTFAYFDATDAPTALAGSIRRIGFSLAGMHRAAGYGPERYSLAGEARPRNLL